MSLTVSFVPPEGGRTFLWERPGETEGVGVRLEARHLARGADLGGLHVSRFTFHVLRCTFYVERTLGGALA